LAKRLTNSTLALINAGSVVAVAFTGGAVVLVVKKERQAWFFTRVHPITNALNP
jgi:hypothetical protein